MPLKKNDGSPSCELYSFTVTPIRTWIQEKMARVPEDLPLHTYDYLQDSNYASSYIQRAVTQHHPRHHKHTTVFTISFLATTKLHKMWNPSPTPHSFYNLHKHCCYICLRNSICIWASGNESLRKINMVLKYELTFEALMIRLLQRKIRHQSAGQPRPTGTRRIPTCYRLNPTSYQDHKHKTIILSPHVQQPTC